MLRSSVFSPEISDLIIDQLSDDRAALAACACISRARAVRTRYHLFRHVNIPSDRKRTNRFFKLLQSPHQTIKHFIRSLTVVHVHGGGGEFDSKSYCEWAMEAIPRLQCLTSVDALTLDLTTHRYRWGVFFFPCFQDILMDLTIRGWFHADDIEVIDVICSFPLLQHLALDYWGVVPSISHYKKSTSNLKNLCSLRIDTRRHGLLEWFSSVMPLPSLRTLHLTQVSSLRSLAGKKILRSFGPFLECLELSASSIYKGDEGQSSALPPHSLPFTECETGSFTTHHDLRYNIRLRSFALAIPREYCGQNQRIMQDIADLLNHIEFPKLEEIKIRGASHATQYLEGWSSITNALERPQYSHLKSIQFCSLVDEQGEGLKTFLQEKLERFKAQGILGFSSDPLNTVGV